MFCDVLVRTKSCGVLIQVSSSDVSDDVNLKRGLFCWVLKTCVPLSKTDLAELLSAAAWSENVFPEHSAVEWGDVQLPQLPSLFFILCSSLLHLTAPLHQVGVWDAVRMGFWKGQSCGSWLGSYSEGKVSAVALTCEMCGSNGIAHQNRGLLTSQRSRYSSKSVLI